MEILWLPVQVSTGAEFAERLDGFSQSLEPAVAGFARFLSQQPFEDGIQIVVCLRGLFNAEGHASCVTPRRIPRWAARVPLQGLRNPAGYLLPLPCSPAAPIPKRQPEHHRVQSPGLARVAGHSHSIAPRAAVRDVSPCLKGRKPQGSCQVHGPSMVLQSG